MLWYTSPTKKTSYKKSRDIFKKLQRDFVANNGQNLSCFFGGDDVYTLFSQSIAKMMLQSLRATAPTAVR